MSQLFSKLQLRDLEFKNRVFVSPMCQYSAREGVPNDWHLVHLGSRAVGGAALVMVEATGVTPEGRITPYDTGLWNDTQGEAFARIVRFIRDQGSVAGIQLAHAGRKASTDAPWKGGKAIAPADGGWQTLAPSAIPFGRSSPTPREMTPDEIERTAEDFRRATRRAVAAGFEVVELHMAHGYLLHQFLSPLSNRRTDDYGGSFGNRVRFPLQIARAVRETLPARLPLFVRISATDWAEGGWDLPQSIEFARLLKESGTDLVDCSTGGLVPGVKIPVGPGYQVPFAEAVRRETGIATGAVGMITGAEQAEEIIATGRADAIFLARELLRRPYWPIHAAHRLKSDLPWPEQYERAAFTDGD